LPVIRFSDFLCFLFFLLPPPLTHTLFPYTTLFRSTINTIIGSFLQANEYFKASKSANLQISPLLLYYGATNLLLGLTSLMTGKRDRKSTRLNSSHVSISYAVFCLKKNNIEKQSHNN